MMKHSPRGGSLVPGLLLAVLSAWLVAACGGDSPSEPTPDPITITITGVEDGATYEGPVTIGISTNRGTIQAELDGQMFLSGQTVTAIGAHTLTVTARDAGETASASVGFEIVFTGESWLIVRMIDLGANDAGGGGDAILLTDSVQGLQRHALVDAGPAGADGSQPGYVATRLQALGVETLEAVLLTHAHSDHFAGLPPVLNAFAVRRFFYNGQVRNYSDYSNLIAQATTRADSVIVPGAVREVLLGGEDGTRLTVIPPLAPHLDDPAAGSSELNNGSLGTGVAHGAFRMFMTGDGEVEANARWRTSYGALSGGVDVLKVGHHGANDAIFDNGFDGNSSWLDHTDPETMLISANGTSHPRQHALTKILARTNTRTYCTHVHGDIALRVSPAGGYTVTVEKNADADCVPGTDATS